ncbi:MAG: transposase [Gemmatimonadaceae bacterium]
MVRRHELTDGEWARNAPLLPPQRTQGTWYKDHRLILNGMLYRHATGIGWRDLPERRSRPSRLRLRLEVQLSCSASPMMMPSGPRRKQSR